MSYFGHIKPNIIASIFCKVMECGVQNFTPFDPLIEMLHILPNFLRCLQWIWLFCPKFLNFRLIQLGIIVLIFRIFINYHCAKYYNYALINADMTNISNVLRFLHKIWLFCPKISNVVHISPVIVVYILYKVMDYPCANCYTIWSSNVNTENCFQFLTIFAQNAAIFPLKGRCHISQKTTKLCFESGDPKEELRIGILPSSKKKKKFPRRQKMWPKGLY